MKQTLAQYWESLRQELSQHRLVKAQAPFGIDGSAVDLLGKITDPDIVNDIYDRAEKQLLSEDAHSTRLDARGVALFGTAGFSMTVAFSFGGWALLEKAKQVFWGSGIAVAFVVVLLLGLITSWLALRGILLKAEGHRSVDGAEVFSPQVLTAAGKKFDYRIHLAVHMWLVWQERATRNEARALTIQKGQRCFVLFLLGILILSGLTTVSALRGGSRGDAPSPNCSGTSQR